MPITMTRAEYQATYGAPPNVPAPVVQSPPVDQTPITMTKAQFQATYGQAPTPPATPYEVSMGIKNQDGTPNTDKGIISNTISQVKNDLSPNTQGSPLSKGIQATTDVFSSVGQLPILKQIGEVFGKGVNFAGEQLSKLYTPEFQKELGNMSEEDFTKATQPLKDLSNLGTIANTILMTKGGEKVVEKAPEISNAVNTGVNAIKNKVSDLTTEKPMTPEEMKINLQSVADDWAKPTTLNEPKYNNARAVLEKDPEVTKTLAQNGLNPFAHIEDGKYLTLDTVKQLRADTGKLSRDILRPSLEKADYTVEKTQITDIKPKANDFGVTPDDAEMITKRLNTKLEALQRKYPDGMSLTNMLDEKITYDKNGGYSQFKSNADTNDAIANRAIADNLRTQLITKAPKDLPIEDFFAEQSKNYRAADYLKSLNGVKAPVDIVQNIARNVAKFGGAKLGAMFGGDVVSSFAGYQIGKVVEKFIENMTNPMRDSFLQNLKITNPEAFTKMQEYLNKSIPPK